jgi:hypothetical protein
MALSWWRGATRVAARGVCGFGWPILAACAVTLSACATYQSPTASITQPRGATVAFESIDGPPPAQFRKLVDDLNDEAQTRRLAVISRESPSAYRVRGYLAAAREKGKTTISWVWDVFDTKQNRALRIDGAEAVNGGHSDAWAAADDDMLRRIAHASMDQLAVFLTSPGVAPATPTAKSFMTLVSDRYLSPEAAGIFRIFHPDADPVAGEAAETPGTAEPAGSVPLPRRRPPPVVASSPGQTLTLAASSH